MKVVFLLFLSAALTGQEKQPEKQPEKPPTNQPEKQPEKKEPQELTRDQVIDEDLKDLVTKLTSDKELESYWAKEELILLGKLPKVLPLLVKTYKESSGKDDKGIRIRHVICEIFGELRQATPEVVEILKDALKESGVSFGTSIASVAVSSLVKLGQEEMIDEFIKMLESDNKTIKFDKFLQWQLLKALGLFRAKKAAPILKKFLADKSKTSEEEDARLLCAQAAESLGKIRDKSAIEDLVKHIEDVAEDRASGKQFKYFVAKALEKITGENKGNLSGEKTDVDKAMEAWQKWGKEKQDEFNSKNTTEKIQKLAQAIEKFEQDQKRLPHNLDELKNKPAGVTIWPEKGYWQEDYNDSWGTQFIYRHGKDATGSAKFDLVSYASDKKQGGMGLAMDIWNHHEWKKVAIEKSKKSMTEIADALDKFKKDCGRYPTILQDLINKPTYAQAWNGPYFSNRLIPKDAFDFDFTYKYFEKPVDKKPYDLICLGYDHKEGGKDIDEDFSIWGIRKPPE
jgi:type II secretion system protein G